MPQHLADSAAVAEYLWENWLAESIKETLEALTGLPKEQLRTIVTWLAGTHDVGKVSLEFVHKIKFHDHGQTVLDEIAKAGLPLEIPFEELESSGMPHGLVGEVLATEWLKKKGMKSRSAGKLAAVIGAHHGIATEAIRRKQTRRVLSAYPEAWRLVQQELLDGMAAAVELDDILNAIFAGDWTPPATELLTGLVVMADWIASNEDCFPLVPASTLEQRVADGVAAVDLPPSWQPRELPAGETTAFYQKSFDWPQKFAPRPVQVAAAEAARKSTGPSLMIIEAPTGEGKTEAALAAAYLFATKAKNQGVFFAAPTMSTANGLFHRTVSWAEYSVVAGQVSSVSLLHSKAHLSDEYRRLRFQNIDEDGPSDHGTVAASEWMRGPKKGILSNFVVATVDQVLMLALQMRHSMLRHLGLAGKVIVIDEVHSYDVYMGSYLAKTLQWLANYGVSVIMLSATLPAAQKHELLRAYQGKSVELSPDNDLAYPLVTIADGEHLAEYPVEPRPTDMTASITMIDDSTDRLSGLVHDLLVEGGCLLIICNTIRRAQNAYSALEAIYGSDVELHHAAFLANDRIAKEDRLRESLGPSAHRGAGRPERLIIVATQVAEQSLDIDADALITDIAPMDLLIQRMGRIHRHKRPKADRPGGLDQAQVFIRGIEQQQPVPVFEGGSTAIYDEALLMQTYAHIPQTFTRPADVPQLVAASYDDAFIPPKDWAEQWEKASNSRDSARQRAEARAETYQVPHPLEAKHLSDLFTRYVSTFDRDVSGEESGVAQVRDADPAVEVVLIRSSEYGYQLMHQEDDATYSDDVRPELKMAWTLANSTVRLPTRLTKYNDQFERVIDELEDQTPLGWSESYLLKGKVALRLNDHHETTLDGKQLAYDFDLGLYEPTIDYENG